MGELKKLILVNPEKAKGTLCKMMREAHEAQRAGTGIDKDYLRFMLDAFALLLRYWQAERDARVEDDVKDMKRLLKEKGLM